MVKVVAGILFMTLFFFYYIKHKDYNIQGVFKDYMYGAAFTSFFFLLQIVCFWIGFRPVYDLSYLGIRYNIDPEHGFQPAAFLSEPAHLAFAIMPATLVAVHNLLKKKKLFVNFFSSLAIVATMLLSTSSTGYIGLFLCVVVIAINYRALFFLVTSTAIAFFCFLLLYNNVPKFRLRTDDSLAIFVKGTVSNEQQLKSGSTMILYNHFIIASQNFRHHPLTGTGLGSHPFAFSKYSQFTEDEIWWAEMNKEDACSLFLRLLSETGVLGLILLTFYLFKFGVNRKNSADNINWIISKALLVYFLCALLRQGNYLHSGLPLYILLYYYVYFVNKRNSDRLGVRPLSLSGTSA
jgi:hypothetical protein